MKRRDARSAALQYMGRWAREQGAEGSLALKVLEALAVHLKRDALSKGRLNKALPARNKEEALLVICIKEALPKGSLRKALRARHIEEAFPTRNPCWRPYWHNA